MTALILLIASTILFIWADEVTQELQQRKDWTRTDGVRAFVSIISMFGSVAIFLFVLLRTLLHGAW